MENYLNRESDRLDRSLYEFKGCDVTATLTKLFENQNCLSKTIDIFNLQIYV